MTRYFIGENEKELLENPEYSEDLETCKQDLIDLFDPEDRKILKVFKVEVSLA